MLRLCVFVAAVLGLPALAFVAVNPQTADQAGPAMLVFLLTPAIAGWALSRGLRAVPVRRPAALGATVRLAGAVTLLIALVGAAGALLGGALVGGGAVSMAGAAGAALGGGLTSVVEELGWSAGGLLLARSALGPRWGVIGLGVIWAAWHLVVAWFAPAAVVSGMFGREDPFQWGLIACFFVSCVVYRFVLVQLRDRANRVWPAVVGHAAPNMLFGALVGSGWAHFDPAVSWVTFPGPPGIPFLLAATAAGVALALRAGLATPDLASVPQPPGIGSRG